MHSQLMEQIEATPKRTLKEALLAEADEQTRRLLTLALDQSVTFGVTVDEDAVMKGWHSSGAPYDFWATVEKRLAQFQKRDLTGNDALRTVDDLVRDAPNKLDLKWFCRILNRNLRAGIDIRTANKVWGTGAVKKFEVQLAETYEGQELQGVYYVQPKLDGNRVVFIDGKAMSRGGKEYPNCEHVIDEITRRDPDFFKNWVLDGEMMGDLGFDKSSGALRRFNKKNREKATFTYYAFDIIRRKEWDSRKTAPLKSRLVDLSLVVGKKFGTVHMVPTSVMTNPSHGELMQFCEDYIADGFEGAMVKDAEAPYKWGRGDNLLKVKKFFDADLQIDGFYEGKGKHRGRLGGIYVVGRIGGRDVRSKVGSGFDDALRDEIWKHKNKWFGAVAQVQYQEHTKDGSLRFPVFIMRRKDKE